MSVGVLRRYGDRLPLTEATPLVSLGEGDDEAEEEEGYTRDELEGMGTRQLRAVAKDAGYSTAELRGYSKDDLVSLLLGEEAGEEE